MASETTLNMVHCFISALSWFVSSMLQVASSQVLNTPIGYSLILKLFQISSYAQDMLGRLSHVAAKRVEQHEETALVEPLHHCVLRCVEMCWGYRMVAGLDISNVPWSWRLRRLRRDAEAKTPFGREHRHNILQHARVGSKSAYWKFIIEMFRSV